MKKISVCGNCQHAIQTTEINMRDCHGHPPLYLGGFVQMSNGAGLATQYCPRLVKLDRPACSVFILSEEAKAANFGESYSPGWGT